MDCGASLCAASAFRPRKTILDLYTLDGGNVSPPLEWTPGPDGTREFLLVMEDPNSPTDQPTVHWIVYHIPPTVTSLPEGAASTGRLQQGSNFKGQTGYAGPAHHSGKPHQYYIEIFALSEVLNVDPHTAPHDLFTDWEGFVLNKGQLIGTY